MPLGWKAKNRGKLKGGVASSTQNQEIFRSTSLNLHNGGTLSHPRVFECMGSFGGPLLANRMPPEPNLDFEPGVHYVEFDHDNLPDVAKQLISDPAKRKAISHAAHKLICDKHTWAHRASQMLTEITAIAYANVADPRKSRLQSMGYDMGL